MVGGGGAVGFSAIQLAVAAGCHVVTTCGCQSIERMIAAGAEQAVDYVAEVVMNMPYLVSSLVNNSDTLIVTCTMLFIIQLYFERNFLKEK